MSRYRKILLLLSLALASASSVGAQVDSSYVATMRRCISLVQQRTAATDAGDWSHLERIATQYIQTCGNVEANNEFAVTNAFKDVAEAQLNLGRPQESLVTADDCIATDYRAWACHVLRLQALDEMKRYDDALAMEESLTRLLSHMREYLVQQRTVETDELRKEWWEVTIKNLDAHSALARIVFANIRMKKERGSDSSQPFATGALRDPRPPDAPLEQTARGPT